MTKKVNPQLFRIKNYNLSNSKYINFFDSLDQYYLIKRNLYFFIKYFTKFKIFIFNFKLQRNNFKIFKIFFFGFFLKKLNSSSRNGRSGRNRERQGDLRDKRGRGVAAFREWEWYVYGTIFSRTVLRMDLLFHFFPFQFLFSSSFFLLLFFCSSFGFVVWYTLSFQMAALDVETDGIALQWLALCVPQKMKVETSVWEQ